jgi:uncharacterized protein (TIGR02646 family)
MIHVDRPSLSDNPTLLGIITAGRKLVDDFLAQPPKKRAQRRAPTELKGQNHHDLGMALYKVFAGKCAYCETAVDPNRPTFDRFWPQSAYPDRAFDWNNLYLCCTDCNLYKSSHFPLVQHGATNKADDRLPSPLLLDPCVVNPEQSLYFLADGCVEALDQPGQATIDTLALNRPVLQHQRRRRGHETEGACYEVLGLIESHGIPTEEFLDRVFDIVTINDSTHLAVVRAVAQQYLVDRELLPDFAARRAAASEPIRSVVNAPARWLRAVKIENFKAIKKLEVEFAPAQQNRQPWLMLLGENGVGKSTVLEAIALAMMAGENFKQGAHKWLRPGSRRGLIRLIWDDGSEDFVLRFERGRTNFDIKGLPPDVPVLAYGATRLLPSEIGTTSSIQCRRNVGNLFDPLIPLAPVQAYLCNKTVVSQEVFDRLAYSLIQVLDLDEENDTIIRKSRTLRARIGSKEFTFANLSGGRKSILALAMDIMYNLAGPDGELRHVEGLVLLDEIELHLHPRWKVKIVQLLRELFPTVRFIATTHDPLCANGLENGELNVMFELPNSNDRDTHQINIPPGTRTDDILTGPWFGLQSTLDEDTWRKMGEHSNLLQNLHRSVDETAEMHSLEQELRDRLGSYGDTQLQRTALVVGAMMRDALPQSRADQIGRARLRAALAGKERGDGNA